MKTQLKINLFFAVLFIFQLAYSSDGNLTFSHYTNEDGLPSSYIKSLCQDQWGFIWAATRSSVCRFDGKHFKTFRAVYPNGTTSDIWGKKFYRCKDSLLIIRTTDDKYYSFNFLLEQFEPYDWIDNKGNVSDLFESKKGFWMISQDSLYYLDVETKQIQTFEEKLPFAVLPENTTIASLKEKGQYLVVVSGNNSLIVFDLEQKLRRSFDLPRELYNKSISVLYIDKNNHAWLKISDSGLWRINLTNGQMFPYSFEQKGNRHLLHNLVHTVSEDKSGNVWIGTEDGLCIWSPYTETFNYYQYNINNPDGLNTNPIYDIFCDRQGNMWLGTYFGGINFWNNDSKFFKVWKAGPSRQHISGNAVSCITEDYTGNIWIGMEDMGVNRIDARSGMITSRINEVNGLSFNNVHQILFEDRYRMWIATYTGGINIYNLKTDKFEYINQNNYPNLPSNNIYHLLHAGDSVFISTSTGVAIFDLKSKTISPFQDDTFNGIQVEYMYKGKDKIWFSSLGGIFFWDKNSLELKKLTQFSHLKNTNFVKTDSKGRVWAGDCLQGLWGYDFKTGSTYCYNRDNGFPFSWIFSMEEGSDGNFWVSGDKGLVRLNPETKEQVWFNRESGLPFEQFNFRASYKDKKGNIFFGGNNGMISFNENDKRDYEKELDVVFRGMQLFNNELVPGSTPLIHKSLNYHPEIHLEYKENVFTIEYSGLHFQNRGICQYTYYLENFEDGWNYVGNRDFATYTNLSPGEYFFHVKASTDNRKWGERSNTLKIIVEPPFWLSKWGFFVYFLLLVMLLLALYLVTTRIQKSKALAEMERKEREHHEALNNFKLEFFTNISHELRTPLTLILAPLSRILHDENLSPSLSKKMKGIKNNVHRLLTLVNQILEFRKIERGKERLQVSHQDITVLLNEIEESFAESAAAKGVKLNFELKQLDTQIWVDCQKLENIVVNIVANALKYTYKGGVVSLNAQLLEKKAPAQKLLEIKIADTGIGIEPSRLNWIFDRFYSTDISGTNINGSSGIGLALVKSLVSLHKGKIQVESKVGKGSEFTVEIPVRRKDYADDEIIPGDGQYVVEVGPLEETKAFPLLRDGTGRLSKKPVLLVIDDNKELLEFISEILAGDYVVVTAVDGEQGFDKVKESLPDLIISDVMMPKIDGLELTRKLKNDIRTSHIPVVLLTAKSGEENEFEGLKTGADYYIEKPFLPHILCKLIENILTTRRNLIERFKSDITMSTVKVACSELDKKLIEKLTNLIKENIDDPDLDVTSLTSEIGISRSLLHVKLKKLTGCSATEFIRSIRLREAVKLIAEGKCNITEAAYCTGFSSSAYFSRRFKEYFGVTPKAYFE